MILTKKFKLERNHVIEINSDIWNICIIRFGGLAGTMPPSSNRYNYGNNLDRKRSCIWLPGWCNNSKQYCFSKGLSPEKKCILWDFVHYLPPPPLIWTICTTFFLTLENVLNLLRMAVRGILPSYYLVIEFISSAIIWENLGLLILLNQNLSLKRAGSGQVLIQDGNVYLGQTRKVTYAMHVWILNWSLLLAHIFWNWCDFST